MSKPMTQEEERGMPDIRVTPEGIEFKAGPLVDVKVDGTWAEPKGYAVKTESGEFYVTVDEAAILHATLQDMLSRATTLAKKRGIFSLRWS